METDQASGGAIADFISSNGLSGPGLLPEQLREFTLTNMRARRIGRFNAHASLRELKASEGEKVIAVDMGGDKLAASYFMVRDGVLVQAGGDLLACQGDGGAGYLAALEKLGERASRELVPVGISFAGPVDGTRLIAAPNLPDFLAEFRERYGSDFARLFPAVQVANDAVAGLMAGAVEAARRYPGACDVIYLINGSGLGGAVLASETVYAAEPGHVRIIGQLNPLGQAKACGLDGARYTCVEAVAASKAGVEDLWQQRTRDRLPGRAISARCQAGDALARSLYDNSARITAHAVRGMADAFGLTEDRRLVVVAHGGIFHVPGYGDRVMDIFGKEPGPRPSFLFTREFSSNMCLSGAAIAATNVLRRTAGTAR